MGHERVGRLPRTHRWSVIVASIASDTPETTTRLAAATLEGVRNRLDRIQGDSGVQAAFQYLVALAQPLNTDRPGGVPDLRDNPSPMRLAAALNSYVDDHVASPEYGALAKQAAADAIAEWVRRESVQPRLFDEQPTTAEIWSDAASGAAFSEVSRLFFARFVDRYIKYFLDREASATLPSVVEREVFSERLSEHLDRVSKHAFETSRITQSFAAGWYNKHAKGKVPPRAQIRGFLAIAFGKIREELRREAGS